jgi:hypothetical protein
MNGRIIYRVLLGLALLAVVAGVGVYAYNFGVARGLAANPELVAPEGGQVAPFAYPFYGGPFGYYRPHFGWGFGPFGCLFPLLGLFLVFALLRGLFWRGHWGWGRGWRHYGPGGHDVPPPFEEWHRRMHETPAQSEQKPS